MGKLNTHNPSLLYPWHTGYSEIISIQLLILGCQPDKLPASLVNLDKTHRSFVFVTGDFILYWISIYIVSIF